MELSNMSLEISLLFSKYSESSITALNIHTASSVPQSVRYTINIYNWLDRTEWLQCQGPDKYWVLTVRTVECLLVKPQVERVSYERPKPCWPCVLVRLISRPRMDIREEGGGSVSSSWINSLYWFYLRSSEKFLSLGQPITTSGQHSQWWLVGGGFYLRRRHLLWGDIIRVDWGWWWSANNYDKLDTGIH